MNQQTTHLPGMTADLTSHQDQERSLLLATLTANSQADSPLPSRLKIALVIDRSGSMSGMKLEITKAAVAAFIRSLDPADRVAVVTYDDHVELLSGLSAPSDALAQAVESIQSGGSTNLYGGWVTGAKIVGDGGRVILLSDGQANAGLHTDALSLSDQARRWYEESKVTTTTIGVGSDYDEGLMAGMARLGWGTHYFAHEATAVTSAFSQERYSTGAIVLQNVSIQCGASSVQLGHFWAGETKKHVFQMDNLELANLTIGYIDTTTGIHHQEKLDCPNEYGYSDDVALAHLIQQAGETEGEMLHVRDPKSAITMKDRLRVIVLGLLAHPSSDVPEVQGRIGRLKASMERLDSLGRNYEEREAIVHRKRSMQMSNNMREPAKSYSSFDDDAVFVAEQAKAASPSFSSRIKLVVAKEALDRAPLSNWIEWVAIPTEVGPSFIMVALENPKEGFVQKEIERSTGLRVRAVFADLSSQEILAILKDPAMHI